MSKKALDAFGGLLMARVRDESITEWQMIVNGHMKGDRAKKIQERVASSADRELVEAIVPQIVDSVLHHVLSLFEQEQQLTIAIRVGNELVPSLREASDGLAGELYSSEGWISRFSKTLGTQHVERTEGI